MLIDTIKYTLLHYEKIYRGVNNKLYLLMCGIFQYSNLFAVGYLISMSMHFSVHTPYFGKLLMGDHLLFSRWADKTN
jgi:hypothetical protein